MSMCVCVCGIYKSYTFTAPMNFLLIIVLLSARSLGPLETIPRGEMVSRRKILSRSRDDLNLEQQYQQQQMQEDEDDVWYQKDKLYKVSIGLRSRIQNNFS